MNFLGSLYSCARREAARSWVARVMAGPEIFCHGEDQHIRRRCQQALVQQALFFQHIEQPGQADGDAHAGQLFVGVVFRQVVVAAARTDGANLRVVGHHRFIHSACVIIQAPGNGQIHGKVVLGHAEGAHIPHHGGQLLDALVQQGILAPQPFQSGHGVGGFQGVQQGAGGFRGHGAILCEDLDHFFPADLFQLVHRPHHVGGLVPQTEQRKQPAQYLAVVHPDLETPEPQGGEGLVDHRGDLRLVGNVQFAIADDVDVCLVEFPVTAPLGPLAPVDFADLVPAERERQVAVVQGHVFGQGHGQIKPQGKVGIPFGEPVDLLFRFAAAFCQQHLRRLDQRGIQGREAIELVSAGQDLLHPVEQDLLGRQQFHETGKGAGFHFAHTFSPLLL